MTGDNKESPSARGKRAELLASHFLMGKGLAILDRNFRGPRGEIDLVARDGGTTVFVEVRFRRSAAFGSAAETVDWRKRQKIVATANYYLQTHRGLASGLSRFDVVAICEGQAGAQIDWIRDAFGETV